MESTPVKPERWPKRTRRVAETFGAKLGFALLPRLPRSAIVFLAHRLGSLTYRFSAKQRRIGLANLDLVYGDTKSPAEKREVLIGSFQTFALAILDSLWFSRNSLNRLRQWISMDEGYDRLLKSERALCITAHFGSWEAIGLALSARGVELSSIANPLKNPAVDKTFVERRKVTGQKVIPRTGAARGILKELREDRKVALVLDQNVLLSEGGVFVDFFGLAATASPIAGAMAIKMNSPIVMGFCLPDRRGHYHCLPPTWLEPSDFPDGEDGQDRAKRLTESMYRVFEREILANPHAWCWSYKRWKFIPEGADRAGYPFYARPINPEERRLA